MYELNPTRAGLLDDGSVDGQGYVEVSLQSQFSMYVLRS